MMISSLHIGPNPTSSLNVPLRVPAQTVDATPSNALIRQCFPGRTDLFRCMVET
jgi:hypothetical protein